MRDNKLHIAKGFFLLLLTVTLLFSSAGIYYVSKTVKTVSSKEEKDKKENQKEEKVFTAAKDAVLVSISNPDFVKEVLLVSFYFPVLTNEVTLTSKKVFSSEKYFRTLFTHIISPNAP
jgi:hypothetical protein